MKRFVLLLAILFIIGGGTWYFNHRSIEATSKTVEPNGVVKPDIKVYFSPNGGIQKLIIEEINKAKSSIDIAIYSFTRNKVAQALARAKKRGVSIRLIMDSENTKKHSSQWNYFDKNGFKMKRLSGKKRPKKDEGDKDEWGAMHHKFIIFDSNLDNKLLMTGSYNISESAEKYNYENVVFISDKSVVQMYQEMFEELWSKEK